MKDWTVLGREKPGMFLSLSLLLGASPLVTISFLWFHFYILCFVGPWALGTPPPPFSSQFSNANGFLPLLVLRSPLCSLFGFLTIPSPT